MSGTNRFSVSGMSKVKVVLNRDAVRAMLQSAEMQDILLSRAQEISAAAGGNYNVYVGQNRANVSIETADEETYLDNLETNSLLKAMK